MPDKTKLLLHACCAPCGTHPIRLLQKDFDVTVFFYNPNIHPQNEWRLRFKEMRSLTSRWNIPFSYDDSGTEEWFQRMHGLEGEPEGGSRCESCYRMRLEATAQKAFQMGCPKFATTLTLSPHKKAEIINRIGLDSAARFGIVFYTADFKKKDGFKVAGQIVRDEGLYRQNYCGCIYSRKRLILGGVS
jgi:predicted adenine nucleotide alpha hydrolase (AANH) superfamily ATPase